MTWIDEMKEAMKAIQRACEKNDEWNRCCECPFTEYCSAIEHEDLGEPITWEIED